MKRALSLLLAMVFAVALFAGCSGNKATTAPGNSNSPASSAQPSNSANTAENGKKSPYSDVTYKDGVPTAPHAYQLPLTKSNDTFTYWFNIAQANAEPYISNPGDLLVWKTAKERTGVNIEYYMVGGSSCATNFSVMIAGDSLMDIMRNAKTYYNGSMAQGIEDGYFANLYDYIENCPNFHYYSSTQGADLKGSCFLDKKTLAYLSSLSLNTIEMGGLVIRGDWLKDYGKTADQLKTYDDLHNALLYFKNTKGAKYPLIVMNAGDVNFNSISLGFGTKGSCGLINNQPVTPIVYENGKIDFPYASTQLKDYLTLIHQWYTEGLFSPDFANFKTWTDFQSYMMDGTSAVAGASPTYARQWTAQSTSGANYVGMARPVKNATDKLHLGGSTLYGGTTYSISADCKNIPLLVSWLDWFYSDEGMKLVNYGVEGVTYTMKDGKPWWTDLMVKNPQGMSLAVCYEVYTGFLQVGLADTQKGTYCDSGKANTEFYTAWTLTPTDRAYEWPDGAQLSQQQGQDFAKLWADTQTYIIENQVKFITGDKPLSDWDSYVADLKKFGNGSYDKCVKIYQDAYDNYKKLFA